MGIGRLVDEHVPDAVAADVVGRPGARVVSCRCEPITGSSGAVTSEVSRLIGVAR